MSKASKTPHADFFKRLMEDIIIPQYERDTGQKWESNSDSVKAWLENRFQRSGKRD